MAPFEINWKNLFRERKRGVLYFANGLEKQRFIQKYATGMRMPSMFLCLKSSLGIIRWKWLILFFFKRGRALNFLIQVYLHLRLLKRRYDCYEYNRQKYRKLFSRGKKKYHVPKQIMSSHVGYKKKKKLFSRPYHGSIGSLVFFFVNFASSFEQLVVYPGCELCVRLKQRLPLFEGNLGDLCQPSQPDAQLVLGYCLQSRQCSIYL